MRLTPLLLAAFLAGASLDALGSDAVSVDIVPLATRSRSSAPIDVLAIFDVASSGLVEGHLELVLYDSAELRTEAYVYRTESMSLLRGEQRRRITLPAITAQYVYDGFGVDAYWIDAKGGSRQMLGQFPIPAASSADRGGIICVSDPWRGSMIRYGDIISSLRIEQYDPQPTDLRRLNTSTARLGPESMPRRPLGYCSFDMVLLIGEGLDALDQSRFEAILDWVAAGGSVFVATGPATGASHHRFVEALRSGRAATPRRADAGVEYYHVGLGRAVVDTRAIEEVKASLETARWRDVAAFLWKMTGQQREHLAANEKWSTKLQLLSLEQAQLQYYGNQSAMMGGAEGGVFPYQLMPVMEAAELTTGLMPDRVRLIPFGWVLLILSVYLVAIGPGDWFVLGMFRRRKLTWLLFPLVTAAVTGSTVLVCNAYMGTQDHRRAISFVDVGEGGRVLRVNRFELLFAGSEVVADTDARDALLTPMDHRMFGNPYYLSQYGGRYRYDQTAAPPRYHGRFPSRYRLAQPLSQWTPQLNRTLRIGDGGSTSNEPRLNWDAVDPALFASDAGRRRIVQQLVGDVSFNGHVLLMNQQRHYGLHRASWTPKSRHYRQRHVMSSHPDAEESADNLYQPGTFTLHGSHGFPLGLLMQACCRTPMGMFSVVSQVSPTGGGNFEDLTILDPTDPDQWLLVVVAPDGQDYVVHRRLYFGDT